jgi:PRC-barrel domain protein
MRQHSRCVVAAAAAAILIVAMSLPTVAPAWARIHHRAHRPTNVIRAPVPPPLSAAPVSGMRSSDMASLPRSEVVDAGKTALPSSLGAKDAVAILGKNVHSSSGEDMGRLVDVIVDAGGRPRAAIIDFGGFLGVGSRKIAVDWSVLKFAPGDEKGNVITVTLTRDQVKAAPEFKEGSPLVALGESANQPPKPSPQAQEK